MSRVFYDEVVAIPARLGADEVKIECQCPNSESIFNRIKRAWWISIL